MTFGSQFVDGETEAQKYEATYSWRKIWTGTQGWGASEGLPGEGKRQPDTLANAWLGQSGGTFLISFLLDELGS